LARKVRACDALIAAAGVIDISKSPTQTAKVVDTKVVDSEVVDLTESAPDAQKAHCSGKEGGSRCHKFIQPSLVPPTTRPVVDAAVVDLTESPVAKKAGCSGEEDGSHCCECTQPSLLVPPTSGPVLPSILATTAQVFPSVRPATVSAPCDDPSFTQDESIESVLLNKHVWMGPVATSAAF
jgi:hypothetical protein